MRRLDERVLGPPPLLTPEQARQEAEFFKLDLGDGFFGLGLAALAVMLLAVFVAWQLGVLLLGAVCLWWLAFLGYQLARGERGGEAINRAVIYGFAWSSWF